MSTDELDKLFDNQTMVLNCMMERGGVDTRWDLEKVRECVKDLEEYSGKRTLVERYLIWRSIRLGREIIKEAETQGVGTVVGRG